MARSLPSPAVRLSNRCLIVTLLFFAAACPAIAQVSTYPDWLDSCEITDPAISALLTRECALIRKEAMVLNSDGSYRMLEDQFTYLRGEDPNNPQHPFCPGSQFCGQVRAAGPFVGRSGVLVAPNLVLTAAHGVTAPYENHCLNNWYFVFDYYQSHSKHGACVQPDMQHIPASNVYSCASIVRNGVDEDSGIDMLLVLLDRDVTGRSPLRVRRSGRATLGDRLIVIGHPDLLSAKVETGVTFLDDYIVQPGSFHYISFAHIHGMGGSSGSMIYNLDQELIESVQIYAGCTGLEHDSANHCYFWMDQPGCVTSGSYAIQPFSQNIPTTFELLVAPIATVAHQGSPGGPVSNADTTYTLSVPARLGAWLPRTTRFYFKITDPSDVEGSRYRTELSYNLTLPNGRTDYYLDPGETATLVVHAGAGNASIGTYARELVISNSVNEFQDRLRHTIVLGP